MRPRQQSEAQRLDGNGLLPLLGNHLFKVGPLLLERQHMNNGEAGNRQDTDGGENSLAPACTPSGWANASDRFDSTLGFG